MTERSAATLLTFAPMIDSELARLVLGHYDVAYREADHLFGWVSLLTLLHGGHGPIPLLYGPGLRLTSPRPIAEHFDPNEAGDRRLLPDDPAWRAAIDADWMRYNGDMGTDVAVVVYYYMLPKRDVMTALFARSLPAGEALIVPRIYPLLRWLFTRLLGLSQPKVDAAVARIRQSFAETDRKIADGRTFLDGGRLTLADLALAASAAPLLLPDHYTAPVPLYADMPPVLQAIVDELRAHPTARFVAQLYAGIARQPA